MLKLATVVHWVLGNYVSVTNVSGEGGNQLGFSVIPEGVGIAQWAAEMAEAYAALADGLAHIPLLGTSIANLLLVLMG